MKPRKVTDLVRAGAMLTPDLKGGYLLDGQPVDRQAVFVAAAHGWISWRQDKFVVTDKGLKAVSHRDRHRK